MKKIYIDMDGVLCEFLLNQNFDDFSTEGYFENLRPCNNVISAVKYLIKQDNLEVYILSSVIDSIKHKSIVEKSNWLDKYLPEIDKEHRIFSLCSKNKSDYFNYLSNDDVLCDDYSKNLDSWVNAGGKGIKILNNINGKKGSYSGLRINISKDIDLYNAIFEKEKQAS